MENIPNILQVRLGNRDTGVLCLAVHDDAGDLDYVTLSEVDRARLAGLQRQARRQDFIRSRRLLYTAAALLTDTEPVAWSLSNAPGEAPVLCGLDSGMPSLHASLSHGGSWTAAVVSEQLTVGVDVETGERSIRRTGIANYLGWPDTDESRWLAHWTLWEAAAKCARQSVFYRRNPAFAALVGSLPDLTPAAHYQDGYCHALLAPDSKHRLSIVVQTDAALELYIQR